MLCPGKSETPGCISVAGISSPRATSAYPLLMTKLNEPQHPDPCVWQVRFSPCQSWWKVFTGCPSSSQAALEGPYQTLLKGEEPRQMAALESPVTCDLDMQEAAPICPDFWFLCKRLVCTETKWKQRLQWWQTNPESFSRGEDLGQVASQQHFVKGIAVNSQSGQGREHSFLNYRKALWCSKCQIA